MEQPVGSVYDAQRQLALEWARDGNGGRVAYLSVQVQIEPGDLVRREMAHSFTSDQGPASKTSPPLPTDSLQVVSEHKKRQRKRNNSQSQYFTGCITVPPLSLSLVNKV